jgi:hypothetical protein
MLQQYLQYNLIKLWRYLYEDLLCLPFFVVKPYSSERHPVQAKDESGRLGGEQMHKLPTFGEIGELNPIYGDYM